MKLTESKEKFINAWGTLGTSWGINRTMAQVHALLLISPDALTAEEIMEDLNISRGNANMNVRTLIDWGLVQKELRPGERKEYFKAEKDIYVVFKQIAKERRKRELEPIFKVLEEVKKVDGDKRDRNIKAFVETIEEIERFTHKADRTLETLIKADENWLIGSFMKLMK
jgi:DNA-binding transcriptional regulator GbsR (MarR family)